MKRTILALLLLVLVAVRISRPQQSLSLVAAAPIMCVPGQYCGYPHTFPNHTGIAIIRTGPPTITDSHGNIWTRDLCGTYSASCFYHTYFTDPLYPGDQIFYSTLNDAGALAVLLMYPGKYDFAGGRVGDYSNQNYVFDDCVNNQNCPYTWTLPIDTAPGDLEVCFADKNNLEGYGHGIPHPGWGFQVEFNNTNPDQTSFAVLDKISPGGVEFCSMEWENGSHWLAGLAVYRKETVQ